MCFFVADQVCLTSAGTAIIKLLKQYGEGCGWASDDGWDKLGEIQQ